MEYNPIHRLLPEPNYVVAAIMLLGIGLSFMGSATAAKGTMISAEGDEVLGESRAEQQEAQGEQEQINLETVAAGQEFEAEIEDRNAQEETGIGQREIDDFITENSQRAAASRAQRGGKGLLFGIEQDIYDEQRINEGVSTIAGNTQRKVSAAENKAVINRFNARTNVASGQRIFSAAKKSAKATRIGSRLGATGKVIGAAGTALASAGSIVADQAAAAAGAAGGAPS